MLRENSSVKMPKSILSCKIIQASKGEMCITRKSGIIYFLAIAKAF